MGISIIPSLTKFQWDIVCRADSPGLTVECLVKIIFGVYLIVTNSTTGFMPHSRLKHSEKVVNSHLFVTYVSFMCH